MEKPAPSRRRRSTIAVARARVTWQQLKPPKKICGTDWVAVTDHGVAAAGAAAGRCGVAAAKSDPVKTCRPSHQTQVRTVKLALRRVVGVDVGQLAVQVGLAGRTVADESSATLM